MSADFGDVTNPVARKKHKCQHCRQAIVVGERHEKFAGKWEGDFQNWRVHLDCVKPQKECQDDFGQLCDEKHPRGKTCKFELVRDEDGEYVAKTTVC